MASLQDLLLVRELRAQQDPFRIGLRGLAQGISEGIDESIEKQKKKKLLAEQNDLVMKKYDKLPTNAEKSLSYDAQGRASFTVKTGGGTKISSSRTKASEIAGRPVDTDEEAFRIISKEKPATKATRIKNEAQAQAILDADKATEEFNTNLSLPVQYLTDRNVSPSDAKLLELQRQPIIDKLNAEKIASGETPVTASTEEGAVIIGGERYISKGLDASGRNIGYERVKDISGDKLTERLAITKADVKKGVLVSSNNLDILAGVMHDFSQLYTDAFNEGGAGGIIQKGIGKTAATIGDLPFGVKVGSKFPASGALPGKREEVILKMMPMLTQQSTKPEGSVRIITSVLEALGKTIPDANTAPATAIRQMEESLRTFYRFARAAEQLDITLDQVFSTGEVIEGRIPKDRLKAWVQTVDARANNIEIGPDEKVVLDKFTDNVVSPIRTISGFEKNASEISNRLKANRVRQQALREQLRKQVGE